MALKEWANKIVTTDDSDERIRALVYGRAGSGKTTFASTFPKPFFIDADKGLRTLRGSMPAHIAVNRGERVFDVVMQIMQAIRKGEEPFDKLEVKTIVIDSLSALGDMLMYEAMAFPKTNRARKDPNAEKADFDHWGEVLNRQQHIVKYARDCGLHVVATAGVKLERDELRGTFVGHPDIPGQYRTKVSHEFDEVLFFEVEQKGAKIVRKCHSTPYLYYEGKSRSGLPPVIEAPIFTSLYGENATS